MNSPNHHPRRTVPIGIRPKARRAIRRIRRTRGPDLQNADPQCRTGWPPNSDDLYNCNWRWAYARASRAGVEDPEQVVIDAMVRAMWGFDPARGKFAGRLSTFLGWRIATAYAEQQEIRTVPWPEHASPTCLVAEFDTKALDLWIDIHEHLREQDPEFEALLQLRFRHGLTWPEFAQLAGAKESTIKNRFWDAAHQLALDLPDYARNEKSVAESIERSARRGRTSRRHRRPTVPTSPPGKCPPRRRLPITPIRPPRKKCGDGLPG